MIISSPTNPRTRKEKSLVDRITEDPELHNLSLRVAVKAFIDNKYVLTIWRHRSANLFRYSFENKADVRETRASYKNNPPVPCIMGVRDPYKPA